MSAKIPAGWAKTTLGQVNVPSRARILPRDVPDLPYVGMEHVESQTMRLLGTGESSAIKSSSIKFNKGDVLYGKMRPYLNKVWLAEFDGLCSAEFLVFPQRDGVSNRFLAYRLNSQDFVNFANQQVSGDRPRADFEKLASFPYLLPPTREQERIVAKLDTLLSRIQNGEAAALRALERLQRYRSTVLRAAVLGELSREWRNSNRTIENGTKVLRRLLEERRSRWEKSEIKRLGAAGKLPKDENWKHKYREPVAPNKDDLRSIPKDWDWASLDMIAELGSGISVSQNRVVKNAVEVPYLRVANVLRGALDLSEIKTIRVDASRLESFLLEPGDILFNEGGDRDKLGRGWIWEGQISQCVHQNHVFRARLVNKDDIDPKLVSHWGNTVGQQFFMRHGTQTTNLASINRGVLARLPVPIIPVAEQKVILSEIDRRVVLADRLAAALNQQLQRARSTRQSVLHEAFSGSLVPQNPEDEPASKLLDQIREAQALDAEKSKLSKRVRAAPIPDKKKDTVNMNKPLPTMDALVNAWQKIGKKPDANELFQAAGFALEQVTDFYGLLRTATDIVEVFKTAAKVEKKTQKAATVRREENEVKPGQFRLVRLWLEDFKNLKNYEVSFDPAHGLDIVLGWNGTGKSNLFESLVIIFRDLHYWWEKNKWPDEPMAGFHLVYEIEGQIIQAKWNPTQMKRPELGRAEIPKRNGDFVKFMPMKREDLPLPRFVFGYYSGPTNRLAEHFLPMKRDHYDRLRIASSDDPKTLAGLLHQRRFFCAETHHAKYVLLAFSYKEDPKIRRFLEERLRIIGFESALFVIRKPRWAKGTPADFWGATGIMRRVMEKLKRYAVAPMVLRQKVSDGYRLPSEELYYFFLPDLKSLHEFAAEYSDARSFFLALESTDFSELIHDVKIQVRVKAADNQNISITFRELSEGEQQLLMVLGLMRFTKSHQSLILLDEPDTHLNPHWSVDYIKDLAAVVSDEDNVVSPEQQTSQLLMATHDPLVIASLLKEQIHLLKRDPETLACRWEQATVNPRGLGFTGILTSEMFGFRSDLDLDTLADLDNRVRLVAKETELTQKERKQLEEIDKRLTEAGFSKAFSDPYYAAFVRAWGKRYAEEMAGKQFLTEKDKENVDRLAKEVLTEAIAEVEKEAGGNAVH